MLGKEKMECPQIMLNINTINTLLKLEQRCRTRPTCKPKYDVSFG